MPEDSVMEPSVQGRGFGKHRAPMLGLLSASPEQLAAQVASRWTKGVDRGGADHAMAGETPCRLNRTHVQGSAAT